MPEIIACIDTNILLWGVKKQSSEGQEERIGQAIAFLKELHEKRVKTIVPSPVIAEVLTRSTKDERRAFLKDIAGKFRIAPFDTLAAVKFSEIFSDRLNNEIIKQYRKEYQTPRGKMKFDLQIIAIALVQNADVIYSNDPDMTRFGEGLIRVEKMPNIPHQLGFEF